MNANALSDLILALVCAYLGWSAGRQRAAWTGGMLILGIASTLGVLRFSEVPWALGPHKFMSVFSACVSFTLFAIALRWPFSPTSTRMAAAGRFIVLVGGFGVSAALTVAPWWGQALPGLSIILIVATMLQRKSLVGILGALSLVGGFAVFAAVKPDVLLAGMFNKVQALHYLLAIGLLLLSRVKLDKDL